MENHQHQNQNPEANLDKPNQQGWGTWEELLLAFAVNRHGFKDWQTIAMEVQSRTTRPHLLATPTLCEQKFHDLNRRFTDQCNNHLPPPQHNGAAVSDDSDHVPWLDELRKLRVDELRRDVQRRDVSIMSLQLQVKTLEEENSKERDGNEEKKPDLPVTGEKKRSENDKAGGELEETEPVNSEPEPHRLDESPTNTDKLLPTTGDESDRENQSVNESNSTGSRFEAAKTGEVDVKLDAGPVQVNTGLNEPDPVKKPIGEESNNGSYDNEAKVPTGESVPPSEKMKGKGDSSDLHDSVTHSGERGTRDSGEVESSASLTKKRKTRRKKEVSGGEMATENEEGAVMKSEPLVNVLEMIKGHENISFFERRLQNEELDSYKDIVRQHVDLETIQLRLQEGHYSSLCNAFFRDLHLLFSNAIVFFPDDSIQSQTAQQLRRLIVAEMNSHSQAQSDPIPQKNDHVPPNPTLAKPDSLLSKHKASAPILVCRKRSIISVKSSSTTFSQKGDHQSIINDKKEKPPSSDGKSSLKPYYSETDEEELPKAKEKPVTGARSMRRSNKNLNSNARNKKSPSNSTPKATSPTNKPVETPKLEKNKSEPVLDKKRNAAADFLKRIKRNVSAEVPKSSGGGGGGSSSSSRGGGGGASVKEQKKVVNGGKVDKGKERASRQNDGGGGSGSGSVDRKKKEIDNNSQSKRSVGRPPKKTAETSAGSTKRG